MDLFSEVRATLHPGILDQEPSFHRILEEVEARTNADIRFTKRSYVFCGTWSQIQLVREILAKHYQGKPSRTPESGSYQSRSRSSYSTNSETSGVHSLDDGSSNSGAHVDYKRHQSSPQQELAYTAFGSSDSDALTIQNAPSLDQTDGAKEPPMKAADVHDESTSAEKIHTVETPHPSVIYGADECTNDEFPEMMMDTDMWEYMEKKNAFEIRQLRKNFNATLEVTSEGDLTRVIIVPDKPHKTSADSLEAVHGVLGTLYQNLFSSVVVETCEVPSELDNPATCQSALDEVAGMFYNILTKQSEYDPRLFRFIGVEKEAKSARYTFMELIGMRSPPMTSFPGYRSSHDREEDNPAYMVEEESGDAEEYAGACGGQREDYPSVEAPLEQTTQHVYQQVGPYSKSDDTCHRATGEVGFPTQTVTQEGTFKPETSSIEHGMEPIFSQNVNVQRSTLDDAMHDDDDEFEDKTNRESPPTCAMKEPVQYRPSGNTSSAQDLEPSNVDVDQRHILNNEEPPLEDLIDFDAEVPPSPTLCSGTSTKPEQQKGFTDYPMADDYDEKKNDHFSSDVVAVEGKFEPEEETHKPPPIPTTFHRQQAYDKFAATADSDERTEILSVPSVRPQPNAFHTMLKCRSLDQADEKDFSDKTAVERVRSPTDPDPFTLAFLDREAASSPEMYTDDKGTHGGQNQRATNEETSIERTEEVESKTDSIMSRFGKSGGVMPAHNPFEDKPREITTKYAIGRNKEDQRPASPNEVQSGTATGTGQTLPSRVDENKPTPGWSSRLLKMAGSICESCMEDMLTPREMPCTHVFCQDCADIVLLADHTCPRCGADWWKMEGMQPEGDLNIVIDKKMSLPGFQKVGTICISFLFHSGKQDDGPQAGRPYRGMKCTTYLPNNADGRNLLKQLKKVFDRKLLFTTARQDNNFVDQIEIVGVTLKTEPTGRKGYPDLHYLETLKEDLKYRGASYDV